MARRLRDQDGNDLNDDMPAPQRPRRQHAVMPDGQGRQPQDGNGMHDEVLVPEILEQQHADMPDGQVHIMYNRNYRFPNLVDFDKTSKDPQRYFEFVAEQQRRADTFLDRDASLIMQEPFPLEPYKTVKDVILKMGSQFERIYFNAVRVIEGVERRLTPHQSFQRGPDETEEHYCRRIILFVKNSSLFFHAKRELPHYIFQARDYNPMAAEEQDEALHPEPIPNDDTPEDKRARDEYATVLRRAWENHYEFDCNPTIISFLLALRLPVVYRMTNIRDRQYFQFPTLLKTTRREFHYHFNHKRGDLDHVFKGLTYQEFVRRDQGFLYPSIRSTDPFFHKLQEFARLAHNACKAFNSAKQEMTRDTGIQLPDSILTFQDMRRLIQQNRK